MVPSFVQWSKDELTAAIVHSNEIYFFENKNFNTISRRIKVENLSSFSMSPVSRCVAIHSAGKKVTSIPSLNKVAGSI